MSKITFSPKANNATSTLIPQGYTEVFPKLYSEKAVKEAMSLKALFLVGGPGSGKDFLLKQVLDNIGLMEMSAEKVLTFLSNTPSPTKKLASMGDLRQRLAVEQRQGIIVNGTADDAEKILRIKNLLEAVGYQTAMTFVTTTDESSRQRNVARGQRGGRTVSESIRHDKWERSQHSLGMFTEAFGPNLFVFDNSSDLQDPHVSSTIKSAKEQELKVLRTQVEQCLGISATGSIASRPSTDTDLRKEERPKGLRYYGFGRYGKDGMITHHLHEDRMVEITPHLKYSINGPQMIEEQSVTEIDQLAKKHGVSQASIMAQLEMGIEVEMEHTKDQDIALKIALDHLRERPDYYTKLKTLERSPIQKLPLAQVKKKMQETSFGYDETTPQQWGPDKDEWNMRMGGQAGAPVKRKIFLTKRKP